jgi:hypothetical protein
MHLHPPVLPVSPFEASSDNVDFAWNKIILVEIKPLTECNMTILIWKYNEAASKIIA